MNKEITDLFYRFVHATEDTDWKEIIMDLCEICDRENSPFSLNAKKGIMYWSWIIFGTQCNKCHDRKAYYWLLDYAKAWLNKGPLPQFYEGCFIGDCDGKV